MTKEKLIEEIKQIYRMHEESSKPSRQHDSTILYDLADLIHKIDRDQMIEKVQESFKRGKR